MHIILVNILKKDPPNFSQCYRKEKEEKEGEENGEKWLYLPNAPLCLLTDE